MLSENFVAELRNRLPAAPWLAGDGRLVTRWSGERWRALLLFAPVDVSVRLMMDEAYSWRAVIEAAASYGRDLGISRGAWADVCRVLGRQGAAVALIEAGTLYESAWGCGPNGEVLEYDDTGADEDPIDAADCPTCTAIRRELHAACLLKATLSPATEEELNG